MSKDLLGTAAELAIAIVVEAESPLCRVELRVHDGRARCVCCGDFYIVETNRLDVKRCDVHGHHCDHWQAIWATLLP